MRTRALFFSVFVFAIVGATSFLYQKTQTYDFLFFRADGLIHEGKYHRAIPFLLAAYQKNPTDPRALKKLCALDEQYLDKEAVSVFADKIWENRSNSEKMNDALAQDTANFFYRLKYWDRAEYYYSYLVDMRGRESDRIKLAELWVWQKEYDKAIPVLSALTQKDPKNMPAKKLLADALLWRKRYPEAIALYQAILAAEPSSKAFQLKLADALRLSGSYEEAVRVYKDFLSTS